MDIEPLEILLHETIESRTHDLWDQLSDEGVICVEYDDSPLSYSVRSQMDTAVGAIGGYVAELDGQYEKMYVIRSAVSNHHV